VKNKAENRLVVILLRGAMDGLDVVRPLGDPNYASYRPNIGRDESIDLDGFFGLHPMLGPLHPLWLNGELSFAHAVSTPYRDKRSHFEGQDILENGFAENHVRSGGWLNRALSLLPDSQMTKAISLGSGKPLILSGDVEASAWSPSNQLDLQRSDAANLTAIYRNVPQFKEAFCCAQEMSSMNNTPLTTGQAIKGPALANFAAGKLKEDYRIASFSVNGWDTHADQIPMMQIRLSELAETILTLKIELGRVWSRTTVLCITEFGRTVYENGTAGTDHGTGSIAMFAGGAISGKKILGRWPGLAAHDLYEGRDLMPTFDVRSFAAWALYALFPLQYDDLERIIFPGLQMERHAGMFL
jgi:uncharacterized protein (DUF1501 family)